MRHGRLFDLSDMQVTACTIKTGCGGGWMYKAYEYAQTTAIGLSKEYPYCDACNDEHCPDYIGAGEGCYTTALKCLSAEKIKSPILKVTDYANVYHKSETKLMDALPDHVLTIAMAPCD